MTAAVPQARHRYAACPGLAACRRQGARRRPFRSGVEVVTVSVSVRDSRGPRHPRPEAGGLRGHRLGLREADQGLLRRRRADQPGRPARHQRQHGGRRQHGPRARQAVAIALAQPARTATRRRSSRSTRGSRRSCRSRPTSIACTRVSLEGKPLGHDVALRRDRARRPQSAAERTNRHRALLVITDGVDTGSRLTAPEVSGIASSIDVPVYLLTVVNPLDHPGGEFAVIETGHGLGDRNAGGSGALDRRRHADCRACRRTRSRVCATCSPSCGINTSSPSSRGRGRAGTRSRFARGRRACRSRAERVHGRPDAQSAVSST